MMATWRSACRKPRSRSSRVGYGQSGEEERGQAVVKENLKYYLAQPLRLLKEIEQAVDRERSQYEVEATRY